MSENAPRGMSEDAPPVVRPTFCRICNAGCGLLVTTRGDRVERVLGDPAHPISRGYSCPKGRASAAFHHDPRRLDRPRFGPRGALRDATWEEALDDLATRLRAILDDAGPEGVAGYLGTAVAFDSAGYETTNRFLTGLGTRQRYTCATVDTPCKPLVSELMTGLVGLHPIPDPETTKLLLLVGTNPVVSHGHLTGWSNPVARLRRITRDGEVWVLDPRRTETARRATGHLQARPGTDTWILAALVREILRDGADEAYLARHAHGVQEIARAVAPFDLASAAAYANVDLRDLEALVASVRRHRRLVAVTGTGSTMSANANVNEWLVWTLQVLTGSFEREGGAWFNPGYVARLDRVRERTPTDAVAEPGPTSRPELPRRNDEYPCAALVDEIESGRVRALFVPGGNPLIAFPEVERLRAALASLDVFVVGDVVENQIVELATHVWPCAGQLERADVIGVMETYKQEVIGELTTALVPPAAERRPLWWCFGQLAKRLGIRCLPSGLDVDSCSDDELVARLSGGMDPTNPTVVAPRPGPWVSEQVLPEGRWRLAPAPLVAALAALREPPRLALVPGRQMRTMNSALRDVSADRERLDSVAIHVAPEDATRCALRDQDRVRVRSRDGELVGTAVVDESLREGSVWIPHGWVAPNPGTLTSAHREVDLLTGMILQTGLEVRVERA